MTNSNKIKSFFNKCLKGLWCNLLLFLLILLLIDLIIGAFFFWQYYFKTNIEDIPLSSPLVINQTLLQDFSTQYQARQDNFEKALFKTYPDPFIGFEE